jgi:hypothetical protein
VQFQKVKGSRAELGHRAFIEGKGNHSPRRTGERDCGLMMNLFNTSPNIGQRSHAVRILRPGAPVLRENVMLLKEIPDIWEIHLVRQARSRVGAILL